MHRSFRALFLAGLVVCGSSASNARGEHCAKVRARYSIYANNDYLWVVGSKHMHVAVFDELDRKLEQLGWMKWAAYGDFVICSPKAVPPAKLTNQDTFRVKSYSNIRFARL